MKKTNVDLKSIVESFGLEWYEFKRALRGNDKYVFDSLIDHARRYQIPISKYSYLNNPFEPVIMSILLEHEKQIKKLMDNKSDDLF